MAITTTIARHYAWRMIFVGVLCVVFSLWGAYDLWVKIPRKEQRSLAFQTVEQRIAKIEEDAKAGRPVNESEYDQLKAERDALMANGTPEPVAKWDRPVQWVYIACILAAPSCFWSVIKTRRRVFRLDDDGTLHMPGGTWRADDIAEIDMSRWMAKSIAHVVHKDGTRVMLDDYKHRNLHLIIGAIASRLYPEAWTAEAKPVAPQAEEPPPLPDEADPDEAAGQEPEDDDRLE